jgi:hypothetical protein
VDATPEPVDAPPESVDAAPESVDAAPDLPVEPPVEKHWKFRGGGVPRGQLVAEIERCLLLGDLVEEFA